MVSMLKGSHRIAVVATGFLVGAVIRSLTLTDPGSVVLVSVLDGCFLVPLGIEVFVKTTPRDSDERPIVGTFSHHVASLVRRNWLHCFGIMLSVYTVGCMLSSQIFGQQSIISATNTSTICVVIGFIIAALLILIVSRQPEHAKLVDQVLPIVGVTLLIVAWVFGNDTGGAHVVITATSWGLSTALFGILIVTRLSDDLSQGETGSIVLGLVVSVLSLFLLVVYYMWPILGDRLSNTIHLSLLVLLLAAAAVKATVFRPIQISNSGEVLSERYGLSKRESEILALLIVGRGIPYISDTLHLSQNTVKTHVKRIYQKLGVHSKESLLDKAHELE
ncbi:MAG: helix-turn-helix transcriptional regulator [Coriobacteriia bacterium]